MLISSAVAAAAILSHPGYVPAKQYRFQQGDTYARVAKINQTGYEKLVKANPNLTASAVRPGTVILIPANIRGVSGEENMAPSMILASRTAPTAKSGTYKVRNGDNDWSIAPKFGLTPKKLREMNRDVNWKQLKPGQEIKVPASTKAPEAPTVVASKTPLGPTKTVSVRSGDNDWVIASRYGLKPSELRRLNQGVDWRSIRPGHSVRVPASAVSESTVASTVKTDVIKTRRVAIARDDVNVRAGGKSSARVKTTVAKGEMANVVDRIDGWYKLSFSNGGSGWVRGDMLKPIKASDVVRSARVAKAAPAAVAVPKPQAPKTVAMASGPKVFIARDDVNVRTEAGSTGRVRTTVPKSASARVVARKGEWVQVKFSSGLTGWVRGDMVKAAPAAPKAANVASRPSIVAARVAAPPKRAVPAAITSRPRIVAENTRPRTPSVIKKEATPRTVASSSGGNRGLISTAASVLGTRYRWGGTSRSGFDCSGFTSYVFKNHGVSLPRTSIAQSRTGQAVGKDGLKQGDLVFFKTRGNRVSHVGIYIGNNKFIHASSGGGSVRTNSLSDGYYSRRYAGARRVAGGSSVGRSTSSSSRGSSRSNSGRLPSPQEAQKKGLSTKEQKNVAAEDKKELERAEQELQSEPRADRVQPGSSVSGG